MNSIHRTMSNAGLVRDNSQRILGGVCSGLGRRFGVDPWAVRALFLLSLVLIPGSQVIVYPIAWILMPDDDRVRDLGPQAILTGAAPSAPVAPSPQTVPDQATHTDPLSLSND